MDSTILDHLSYDLRNFQSWQLSAWRKISEDATLKGAFAVYEYDDHGMLKPYLPKFEGLFRWLVCP